MKHSIFFSLSLIFLSTFCLAQKKISGKSQKVKFRVSTDYKRGIPPNLFLDMSFEDKNKNGVLEAEESANLHLRVSNKGKGSAQGLLIIVEDNLNDGALVIKDSIKIPYIHAGKDVGVDIPISAKKEIKSNKHKFKITVAEHFGYDMDPAYLILNSYEYQEPKLVFSGYDIVDNGEETMSIVEDKQLQPGEMVRVKLMVQNTGQNIAPNTKFTVHSTDKNIYLGENSGQLGTLKVGEVKEFWLTLSPNKRVKTNGKLPLYLTLENDLDCGELQDYQLPVVMNQDPPEPDIVQVEANVESLQKQVARFEYTSNKITANIGNIINIRDVTPSKTHRPNSVAILIGVENYKHFAPAPYATNDVKVMAGYCRNVLGISKVFSYTNEEVNGFFFGNIFNPTFGELQKAIIKGETELFVFYSGHGMPSKVGNKIYLFPSDGRTEALEVQGYNINDFYTNLNELEAKETTVFIDACFSGVSRSTETHETQNLMAMKGVRIKPEIESPWDANPNFSVFTSSGYNETSLGFDLSRTGLFTYYICTGLQGEADTDGDKKITTGELSAYVSKNVKLTSKKILGLQSPQFYGNKNQILTEY